MAEIELNLKPEDINRIVSEAILNSIFGKRLIEEINKKISGHQYPDNIIHEVLVQEMKVIIKDIINREFKELVTQKVREKMTETFIEEAAISVMNKMAKGQYY